MTDRATDLLVEVAEALTAARYRHAPMHSPHEGISVIREEVDELWEHVRADTGRSAEARKEALQIAAMSFAAAILAHPFTPAQRAAIAAELLTPEVLADALAVVDRDPRGVIALLGTDVRVDGKDHPLRTDWTDVPTECATAILAALRDAGKEPDHAD